MTIECLRHAPIVEQRIPLLFLISLSLVKFSTVLDLSVNALRDRPLRYTRLTTTISRVHSPYKCACHTYVSYLDVCYVRIRTTRDISLPVAIPVYLHMRWHCAQTVRRIFRSSIIFIIYDDTYDNSKNVDKPGQLCHTIATAIHHEPARRGLFPR